jgi:hypothetical protein
VQIDSTDPVTAMLDPSGGNTAQASLVGEVRATGGTAAELVVEVYENLDTNDVIWVGRAKLYTSGGLKSVTPPDSLEIIGWDPGDFTLAQVGDTAVLTINATSGDITYEGVYDSLGIILSFDPQVGVDPYNMPTLTPYGVAVLTVLLLATAVWLYRRKRLVRT